MTIRVKLTLFLALFSGLLLTVLGYFLIVLERNYTRQRSLERVQIMEQSLRRAAQDSLIQKDALMLLSDIKSLRNMFPPVAYCESTWTEGKVRRNYHVGQRVGSSHVREFALDASDPGDASRRVHLDVGIDYAQLEAQADENMGRLARDMARLFGLALLVSIFFSDWLARRISTPLIALSRMVSELGQGRLGTQLEWESADEVGTLVKGVNAMSLRLEELDSLKRDFISAVTHELRSPLGAIESFINLLEAKLKSGRPADPALTADYMARIRANVRRLSGFISDLLDVAKLERGKMECVLRPVRLQDVALDVVQFFGPKAKEQGVALAEKIPADLGEVSADPERLRQVLVNLISNALKFTPKKGRIDIQAEQYREREDRFVEVSVSDTGTGIEDSDLDLLFQKFSQGRMVSGEIAGPKGTGLGLYIVKSIVEAHGGKVGVKSTPGKGTRFYFNLRMS